MVTMARATVKSVCPRRTISKGSAANPPQQDQMQYGLSDQSRIFESGQCRVSTMLREANDDANDTIIDDARYQPSSMSRQSLNLLAASMPVDGQHDVAAVVEEGNRCCTIAEALRCEPRSLPSR